MFRQHSSAAPAGVQPRAVRSHPLRAGRGCAWLRQALGRTGRLAHAVVAGLLLASALLATAPSPAGVDRYVYDALGRLVGHTGPQGATGYRYDAAGNLLSVRPVGGAAAPQVDSLAPAALRRGRSADIVLTGRHLAQATLHASHPGLRLSALVQSADRLTARLDIAADVPAGPQVLVARNSAGVAEVTLQVAPEVPVLTLEPSPLALPPDGVARAVTLRLSHADAVPHTLQVTSSDTARLAPAQSQLTFAPGQTVLPLTVRPLSAGFASLRLAGSELAPLVVPVFLTTDFRGVNTSQARAVGLRVGPEQPATTPPAASGFSAAPVGLHLGPVLTGLAPQGLAAGAERRFVLQGAALPSGLRIAVEPADGLALVPGDSDGASLSFTLRASPGIAPGQRRLSVTDASGRPVPFADPAQALVRITAGLPAIDSLDPLFATPGSTLELLVRGQHLQGGQVRLLPPGLLQPDATPLVSADGNQLRVRVQVHPLAAPGPRTVQVLTPAGDTGEAPHSGNQFTVVPALRHAVTPIASALVGVRRGEAAVAEQALATAPPAAAVGLSVGPAAFGAAPRVGVVGTEVEVVVAGTGLQAVRSAAVLPSEGIEVLRWAADADGRQLRLSLRVDAAAPRTLRRLVLGTAAGGLPFTDPQADQFLVAAPAPQLVSISPQVVAAGTTATLTVRGRHFSDLQGVSFEPSAGLALAGTITVAPGGELLTVLVRASADAASGPRVLVVHAAGGSSAAAPAAGNSFQVARQLGPRVDSAAAPLVGVRVGDGAAAPADFPPATVPAPAVGVLVHAAPGAVLEQRPHSAAAVGVVVGAALRAVQPGYPDGIAAGRSGTLRITGFALDAAMPLAITGAPGLVAGTPALAADGRAIDLPVQVPAGTPPGTFGLRVGNGPGLVGLDGRALLFAVGTPPTALDSVGPIILEQGKTYTFTVRGAGLRDVFQVLAEPDTGIAFADILSPVQWSTDALGERLTVQLRVAPDAAPGPRVVRLRVPGALTSALPEAANTVYIVPPQ